MSSHVPGLERARTQNLSAAEVGNDSQEVEEIGGLGQYITQQYGLLQLVLSKLSTKDLRNAALVCRTWCTAARAVRRSRLKPHAIVWSDAKEFEDSIEEACKKISNGPYCEPDLAIVFMNFPACHRKECPVNSCDKCLKVLKGIRSEVLRRCLLVTVRLPKTSTSFRPCGNCAMKRKNLTDVEAWNMINSRIPGFTAAFIPTVPGVTVSVFHVRARYYNTVVWKDCLTAEELENIHGMPPKSEPLRCVLIFHNFGVHNPGLFIKSLEACHGKFAAGGGLCKDATLTAGGFGPSDWSIFGIAFSGQGVKAASLVLGHLGCEDWLDQEFLKVKNCMGSMENSLAIWFAHNEHSIQPECDEHNNEYKCFRRHFPTTPLSGGYTHHKLGHTYLPGVPFVEDHGRAVCQQYTSVFIFLSFTS